MPSSTSRVLSPASLASSFQYVTARHTEATSSSDESFASLSDPSSSDDDDDDEIVWSISDLSASSSSAQPTAPRSPGVLSDDEYILLSPPLSQPREPTSGISSLSASFIEHAAESSSIDGLSDVMSNMNITESDAESVRPTSQASSRRRRKRSNRTAAIPAPTIATVLAAATPIPASTATPVPPAATPRPKKKKASKAQVSSKKNAKAVKAQHTPPTAALGERPIVDDVSEAGDAKTAVYEEAVQYVSEILSAPVPAAKAKSNLTFLQALILELGLLSTNTTSPEQSFYQLPSLPRSLTAAKALLKSSVFLNVRDYLDTRDKGLDALRKVMHPSRKALIKDLSRGKGQRKVPRGYVKNSGLGVLLVSCHH